MLRTLVVGFLLVAVVGCGNAALDEMRAEPSAPLDWPALEQLESEGLMGAGYAADMGNWSAARNEIGSDGFKSAVQAFKDASLPSEWAQRGAAKAEVESKLDELIATAGRNASAAEMEEAWNQLMAAMRKLRGGDQAGGDN